MDGQVLGNGQGVVEGGRDGDVEPVRGDEVRGVDGLDVQEVEVRVGVPVPQCACRGGDQLLRGGKEGADAPLVVQAVRPPRHGAVGGPVGLVDPSTMLGERHPDRSQAHSPGPAGGVGEGEKAQDRGVEHETTSGPGASA